MAETKSMAKAGVPPSVPAAVKPAVAAALHHASPTTANAVHSSSHVMAETNTMAKAGVPPSVPAAVKPEMDSALHHAAPPLHSQSIKTVSNNAHDDSFPANFFVF
jgi:hypothetical protein